MVELIIMIIDDSFLNQEEIISLQKMMYDIPNSNFPWYFYGSTNKKDSSGVILNNDDYLDSQQFVHLAYHNSQKHSQFSDTFLYIFNKFINKHNIVVDNVFRIKANLILKDGTNNKIHYPHIDTDHEHFVFLYYVNDSDGDTILFNEKYPMENKNLTIDKKINPKAGRAILFNGLQYHSSSSPIKNDIRCVINIDFTGKVSL